MKISQYLDSDNTKSLMRLNSFLAVLISIILTAFIIIFIFLKCDVVYIREVVFLIGVWLGFGFGGKAIQKFAERENTFEKTNLEEKKLENLNNLK